MCEAVLSEDRVWKLTQDGLRADKKPITESLFSQANEYMGIRGFYEESYSSDTFKGCYLNGVYFPDPTKVGWWKNGLPSYYAKLVNIPNWLVIDIEIEGEKLILHILASNNYIPS